MFNELHSNQILFKHDGLEKNKICIVPTRSILNLKSFMAENWVIQFG
jgi:hypothetical protein